MKLIQLRSRKHHPARELIFANGRVRRQVSGAQAEVGEDFHRSRCFRMRGCSMKEMTFMRLPHFGHFSSRNLRFQVIDIPDLLKQSRPYPFSAAGLFLDYLIFSSADTQKKVINLLTGPLRLELDSYLSSIDARKVSNYLDSFNTSATAVNEALCLAVVREISHRKSSSIGKLVKKHFWESDALFSSLGAIKQLEADSHQLKQTEIQAAAKAIGETASHGDLSENAEYHAAIEKRDLLLDKLNRWLKELQRYRPYPPSEIRSDTVSPGIRVQLQKTDVSETDKTLGVVDPLDANPEKGRINYMAPLGNDLLGKSIIDIAVFPGYEGREWRIVSLEILNLVKQ